MADFTFTIAKGRVAHYASLPAANDGLVIIALALSGLEAQSVLEDKDDFAAVTSGTTDEQGTVGRMPLTNVTVTVDDTNNRVNLDADNVTWPTPTGAAIGAFVICYDPDTTTGNDSTLVPLTYHGVNWLPDGNPFTANIADFCRAA